MSKASFLGHSRPLLTTMVQGRTPERVIELMDKALPLGADPKPIRWSTVSS